MEHSATETQGHRGISMPCYLKQNLLNYIAGKAYVEYYV